MTVAWMRWAVLAGGLTACLVSGTLYGFGLFAPQVREALQLTQTQINVVGASGAVGQYLGFVSGIVNDTAGSFVCCVVGGLSLLCGYLLFALSVNGTLVVPWQLLCMMMFLVGQGSFATYTAAYTTSIKNFGAARRSLVLSMHVAAFATSSMLYAVVWLILSRNSANAVQTYLYVLTATTAAVALLCAPLLLRAWAVPKVGRGGDGDGDGDDGDDAVAMSGPDDSVDELMSAPATARVAPDLTPQRALVTADFWALFTFLGLVNGPGIMWLTMQGTLAKSAGASIIALVLILGGASIVGRLLTGVLCDYFASRGVGRCWFLLPPVVVMTVAHALFAVFGTVHISAALVGCAYGAAYAICVTLVSIFFGVRFCGTINGFVAVSPAIFGMALSYLAGRVYDARATEGLCVGRDCFLVPFLVSASVSAMAAAPSVYMGIKHKHMT